MEPVQDKEFDEGWRKKLADFEPAVPEHLWKGIAKQIAIPTASVITEKRRKLPWLKMAAAICLVLGGTYFYQQIASNFRDRKVPEVASIREISTQEELEEKPKTANPLLAEKEIGSRVKNLSKGPWRQTAAKISRPQVLTEQEDALVETEQQGHTRLEGEVAKVNLLVDRSSVKDETLLAKKLIQPLPQAMIATARAKKRFDASDVLNYVVKSVDQGEEKVLSFASDEEGIIKVSVHLSALKIKL